jgi:hypothetical protein
LEYPVPISLTVPSLVIPAREPTNDSTLAFPVLSAQAENGKVEPLPAEEDQTQKAIHGVSVPASLAKEIEQALEMMQRVKVVHLAQGKGVAMDPPGNTYELPEPLVYPVSPSSNVK